MQTGRKAGRGGKMQPSKVSFDDVKNKYTLLLQALGHLRAQFKAIRDLKKLKEAGTL